MENEKYYIEEHIYFMIFEYDVRYFKEVKDENGRKRRKMIMSYNTYPIKPELYESLWYSLWYNKNLCITT